MSAKENKWNDGVQNENDKLVAAKPEQPQDPAEKLHIVKLLFWRWDTGHRHVFWTTLGAVLYSLNDAVMVPDSASREFYYLFPQRAKRQD